MSDTISRRAVINAHKEYCKKHPNAQWYKWSLSIMQTSPSVDVERVVRCKDCKLRDTDDCVFYAAHWYAHDEDYCAYGERRKL